MAMLHWCIVSSIQSDDQQLLIVRILEASIGDHGVSEISTTITLGVGIPFFLTCRRM